MPPRTPPQRPRGRLLRRLGVLLASFLLACLVAEAGVRLFIGEVPKFPRAVVGSKELGLRINLPGARYVHSSADVRVSFHINERGLRDTREFPYEKPPGVKRIVSLGDSFTIGYEVEADQTFSAVMERELRAKGHQVEVLNAGVSGYSNAEELLLLEREMLKYDPDVVVCSFFVNDLIDNVRTDLFTVENGALVEVSHDYIPLGAFLNFLNENRLLLWLSSSSNAFAYTKEIASRIVKRQIVEDNLESLEAAEAESGGARPEAPSPSDDAVPTPPSDAPGEPSPSEPAARRRPLPALNERVDFERELCAAIFERMYEVCHERGIPLVIQSIPRLRGKKLVEAFPVHRIDFERPGLWYVPSGIVLRPYVDTELLYWEHSHRHWTPFSHQKAGETLAAIVHEANLLDGGPDAPRPDDPAPGR